jgi:hypothetical protein
MEYTKKNEIIIHQRIVSNMKFILRKYGHLRQDTADRIKCVKGSLAAYLNTTPIPVHIAYKFVIAYGVRTFENLWNESSDVLDTLPIINNDVPEIHQARFYSHIGNIMCEKMKERGIKVEDVSYLFSTLPMTKQYLLGSRPMTLSKLYFLISHTGVFTDILF